MAVAVDGSTPVRWTGTVNSGVGITSASFTAPTDALLVVCGNSDGSDVDWTPAVSDSGGLTWTSRVARTQLEGLTGGGTAILTARTTSSVSRTVSWAPTWTPSATHLQSAKLYVLTGVDVGGTPVDTVGANNEGSSTTNNLTTTSITAGANGLLICADTDWNELGVFTSSDLTIDTADYAGAISVCSGYKSVSNGASVNGNLDAGGSAAAQHKWCQIIVREDPAGGGGTNFPVTIPQTQYNSQIYSIAGNIMGIRNQHQGQRRRRSFMRRKCA